MDGKFERESKDLTMDLPISQDVRQLSDKRLMMSSERVTKIEESRVNYTVNDLVNDTR